VGDEAVEPAGAQQRAQLLAGAGRVDLGPGDCVEARVPVPLCGSAGVDGQVYAKATPSLARWPVRQFARRDALGAGQTVARASSGARSGNELVVGDSFMPGGPRQ